MYIGDISNVAALVSSKLSTKPLWFKEVYRNEEPYAFQTGR